MGFCRRKGVECGCLTYNSVCNSDNCHRKLPDKSNMLEELKAWADEWGVTYTITEDDDSIDIKFDSASNYGATFHYNKNFKNYIWYGGD